MAPGQIYPYPITVTLKDYEDQIMVLDSTSTVEFMPYDASSTSLNVLYQSTK